VGKIKVLIVDDHPVVRQGIRRILEMEKDMEVVGEAANGSQALAGAADLRPDVILLDISMPGLDGIEVARRLRQACPQIKVIILTVHEQEQFLFQAVQAGVDGYILKDLPEAELAAAIRKVSQGYSVLDPAMTRPLLQEFSVLAKSRLQRQSFLTEREMEVLNLLAQGLTNKEIAGILHISGSTLKRVVRAICRKLQVDSRPRAVAEARARGII
jgi:two-component system NarL family response regulator